MNKFLNNTGEFQNIVEAIKILNKQNRIEAKNRKNKKIQIQNERYNKIMNGENFSLSIVYKNKLSNGLRSEKIFLNGSTNAQNIFEVYKKIGHDLQIYTMTLFLDEEKN